MALAICSPVAKQLGQQLQIRRLAATGAGAGELEQRLEELDAANIRRNRPGPDRSPAASQRMRYWRARVQRSAFLVGHVDGLHVRLARADRRTGFDAKTASGAILHIELQREAGFRIATRIDRG